MGLIKYKLIISCLRVVKYIAVKILYLQAKYESDDYIKKESSFDLRSIPKRIKQAIIHDKEIIKKRLDICSKCEFFISTTSQCRKCGCFMKVKARLANQVCPVDKWGKEPVTITDNTIDAITNTI